MKKTLQMKLYIALHNNTNVSNSLLEIPPLPTILCALDGTLLTFWMSSNLGSLMSGSHGISRVKKKIIYFYWNIISYGYVNGLVPSEA